MMTSIAERYFTLRKKLFEWPRAQPLLNKLALSFVVAALTGVLAQIKFYLPGTPVPGIHNATPYLCQLTAEVDVYFALYSK